MKINMTFNAVSSLATLTRNSALGAVWYESLSDLVYELIDIAQMLSIPAAIIFAIVAAFLYMSSDRKADQAKNMWFRVAVGLFVITTAISLITMIQNFGTTNF